MSIVNKNTIETLNNRFESFIDSEIKELNVIDPTSFKLTLNAQDKVKDFDWTGLEFNFNGVSDAHLVDSSKLNFVDTTDGITILQEDSKLIFGVGSYKNKSSIKNSQLFFECASLKYEEISFIE